MREVSTLTGMILVGRGSAVSSGRRTWLTWCPLVGERSCTSGKGCLRFDELSPLPSNRLLGCRCRQAGKCGDGTCVSSPLIAYVLSWNKKQRKGSVEVFKREKFRDCCQRTGESHGLRKCCRIVGQHEGQLEAKAKPVSMVVLFSPAMCSWVGTGKALDVSRGCGFPS